MKLIIDVTYVRHYLIDYITKKNLHFKRHGKTYSGRETVTHTRGTRTSASQIGMLGRLVMRAGKLVVRERCGHHLCN